MKKLMIALTAILTIALISSSCSQKSATSDTEVVTKDNIKPTEKLEPTVTIAPTKEPIATPEPTVTPAPVVASSELSTDNFDPTATISDTIPDKYTAVRTDYCGTIESIVYDTYDYFGDGTEITKPAFVYLPYGYDETKQYNVLYLMHGIGGSEKEWGMFTNTSVVKCIMDNLIYYGDIEPFIVVVPNGRSSVNYANTSSDHNSFYQFGKELRNDLIPFIEANYATYTDYKDGYDMTASRDHRAMGGLSMGGMQTINIGMCESLDLISYFGAFSACPTTYTASKIAESLKSYEEYDINYFYNICGNADGIAWPSATSAVTNLTSLTDKLIDGENYMWQEIEGGAHDFKVWYLGFYNYAQLVFK